ncbi:MAG: N-formylglutamate amidohydrolase [Phycisphaerae bacterium]|nr:N-formylglutamate amidohydrolase [Phycisphaerae bacterium]
MTLPILISVPHAGSRVPPEVAPQCALSEKDIREDADGGAAEIYDLDSEVAAFLTTDVARAIVDLNRAENDRRPDGVVKTHTCWNVPVYRTPLTEPAIEALLARYYRPYHRRLRELAGAGVRLGVDCHTMAALGPPIGPDPNLERPWVCLSDGEAACPTEWLTSLAACLERAFDHPVSINVPFSGGHIIRSHAAELPWVQLELSRAPFMTLAEKRSRVLTALNAWCERLT